MRFLIPACVVLSALRLTVMPISAQSPVRKTQLVPADALASLSWNLVAEK